MIKRILFFIAAVILTLAISYIPHNYVLASKEIQLSFSLFAVYLFHVIAAIIVYFIVEFIADKMPNQAGYAYLASIFLKIGFFVLIFQASVFANEQLTKPERFSLVIPLFLFLILEAIAVSKLLNSK
ncbi:MULTISPECIES: DUF6168 family protein [Tenacibaculum]|uniref:DUF6168 family protein n=1 Tax=Tenacibaculum TaxID=104267 RepID=UPI001C37B537|nr:MULTISPECIES: DUF6168 family protein [Tenacibaculum]MCF2876090.1 DUF6168 family protein [Tenacibaculum sp. Cn5-1]MCF2936165.1 DUF6168 family protein [Tenacibaculum sp. Cn5-34]MCG7512726.1 DUF6168 family protein [Tenacibaculum sp. Cn5-46]